MFSWQSALSRQRIHMGKKRILVSTQIVTNHFALDNGAEAIWALITVKVEEKTQVEHKNKKSLTGAVRVRAALCM